MWCSSANGSCLRLLSFALQLPLLVRSVDIFVDDTSSSIYYSPSDKWQQGNGCSPCALKPTATAAYNGTWHDTTFEQPGRTISFTFSGTAISAYFIIPDQDSGGYNFQTNLICTLDGVQIGTFSRAPSGQTAFLYNQTLFTKNGLSNTEHTIEINVGASDSVVSAVLFDAFVYSTEDEAESSISGSGTAVATGSTFTPASSTAFDSGTSATLSPSPHTEVGKIAGGVVGGVLGLSIILLLYILYRRRAKNANLPRQHALPPVAGRNNDPERQAFLATDSRTSSGDILGQMTVTEKQTAAFQAIVQSFQEQRIQGHTVDSNNLHTEASPPAYSILSEPDK